MTDARAAVVPSPPRVLQGADVPPASAHLVRVLMRQDEEVLRGLRRAPPRDIDSPSGRQHLMTLQQLSDELLSLSERADWLLRNPPPPRPRRSWLDLKGFAAE